MVYLFGALGLLVGFALGLFVINIFLQHYPTHELVKNKSLRWTYGLACWILAGFGAWAAVYMYQLSVLE